MRTASVHVLRLDEPIRARGIMRPVVPPGAIAWLVGAAVAFAPDGAFDADAQRVQMIGIWDDAEARDRCVAGDSDSPGPWPRSVAEAWHAALVPFRHHGETNWSPSLARPGRAEAAPVFAEVDAAPAPDDPVVVVTTTAFFDGAAERVALSRAMHDVQSVLGDADGLVRQVVSLGRRRDDGRTITVWRDDDAMNEWAYRSTVHPGMIRRQRDEALMPRSSFTRFRVVSARGTWDGADPLRP